VSPGEPPPERRPDEPSLPGRAREEAAEAAAEQTVDSDRLLPGEDVNTPYVDDAEHWIKVYGELLELKRRMIGELTRQVANMTETARREAQDTDLVVMHVEAERFARRLGFWRRRLDELRSR
jgi:hypothetical protein